MKKILIVEDEKDLSLAIEKFLGEEGFRVVIAHDGESALDKFYEETPELVILDINLPKKNGWEICREIKRNSNIPVIMMTARNSEYDEIQGLELGAEDYITKPLSLKVLAARVRKVLKIDKNSSYSYGGVAFDIRTLELIIDGEKVEISPKEGQLLEYFIKNRGFVLSREKILNEIWGFDFYGDDRVVDTLVKRVRKKLGSYSEKIKTLRGIGYIYEENRC
ncbi:MAG: response regulator transcription factor [Fusobacteriaceae bacterium]